MRKRALRCNWPKDIHHQQTTTIENLKVGAKVQLAHTRRQRTKVEHQKAGTKVQLARAHLQDNIAHKQKMHMVYLSAFSIQQIRASKYTRRGSNLRGFLRSVLGRDHVVVVRGTAAEPDCNTWQTSCGFRGAFRCGVLSAVAAQGAACAICLRSSR